MDLTHALSLNDSLWVRPAESDLSWERVNLYQNDFTDVVSKTAFEKGLHGLKISATSPEFTSEGSFEKCWVREDDGIYLYKKGSSGFANAGLEAYSEYYSSQFSALLTTSYVDYDLVTFKGSLVSKCKMFTNENEGFVPIYKYLDYNETFRVLRFAPVFDHNMAMLARAMECDLTEDSPYIASMGHKISGEFIPVARAYTKRDPEIRHRLEKIRDIPLRLHPEYNLPWGRTDFLEKAVRTQIRQILE